jgi:mono/diheme cytochrome c family protein
MDMDWQNEEFETLLRKFRLKEARPHTLVQPDGIRRYRVKIAAAAALVIAIGASAAIVRQRSVRKEVPAVAETIKEVPGPVVVETPVPIATATTPAPTPPQTKTPSIKPDPKAPEPLLQLTKVIPAEPQDAGPLSTQDSPQQAGVEENKGHKAFLAACGSCHAVDLVQNSHFDTPQEYEAIVNRMVNIGAPVSPQETSAIVDYLFKTYGKKPPAAASDDWGTEKFNRACGSCHAPELADDRKGADKETYRTIVNRMIGYGAGVAPDQIDPLVEYLFKTYGRKLR